MGFYTFYYYLNYQAGTWKQLIGFCIQLFLNHHSLYCFWDNSFTILPLPLLNRGNKAQMVMIS